RQSERGNLRFGQREIAVALPEGRGDISRRARPRDQTEGFGQYGSARRGRHEAGVGFRVLIAAEEEDLVFHDRAADGEAAFVAARFRLIDAVAVEEIVVGVERLVL